MRHPTTIAHCRNTNNWTNNPVGCASPSTEIPLLPAHPANGAIHPSRTASATPGARRLVNQPRHDLLSPRLPVHPGETMLSTSHTTPLGGKGANTAVAACRAGAQAHFLGTVGCQTDVLGQLSAYGVHISAVQTLRSENTGQAVILLDANKENSIIVHPGANALLTETILDGFSVPLAEAVVVLHSEIDHAVVQKLARRARLAGAFVILNPSPMPQPNSPLLREDATVWSSACAIIMNEV